jgi:putative nucleotidyltransferase with HDIG domain
MTALLIRSEPAPPPAQELRRAILLDLDRVGTYPTLSDTALRVMTMADREDVSIAEVAAVVRRDGVLAASVLRVANCVAVRGRNEISDLQGAILRIGIRECTRVLAAMGVRRMYEGHSEVVRARCDALLRHSLFVARLASGLAKLGGRTAPEAAFTAGLLHDMGRVVMCVKCGTAGAEPPPAREDDDTPAAERETYGVDHCAVGYQFATRNALPEGSVRAALNHHRPEEEQLQQELVALVAVAERVGNHAQWNHTVSDYKLKSCPRFEVLSMNWGQKSVDAFAAGLAGATVRAIRDTRKMLKALG